MPVIAFKVNSQSIYSLQEMILSENEPDTHFKHISSPDSSMNNIVHLDFLGFKDLRNPGIYECPSEMIRRILCVCV